MCSKTSKMLLKVRTWKTMKNIISLVAHDCTPFTSCEDNAALPSEIFLGAMKNVK